METSAPINDSALSTPAISQSQPVRQEKKNKIIPILLIVLSIISISLSIFFVLRNTQTPPQSSSTTPSTVPNNWKKYVNTVYGFSFYYPEEFAYIGGRIVHDDLSKSSVTMFILENYDGSTRSTVLPTDMQLFIHISDLAGKFTLIDLEEPQTLETINGVPSIRTTDSQIINGVPTSVPLVLFQSKPYKIAIQLSHPDSIHKDWFEQIVQTFEFFGTEEDITQIETCKEKTTCDGSSITNLGCANPATTFCTCMNGTIKVKENEQGTYNMCVINGTETEEWEYYRSKISPQ